ncbi:MAG: c-type cytochrome [Planctomycetota bacterium]
MTTLASISDFFAWFSGPWMPEDGGGFADNVDALNGFILAVSYFFVILIAVLMIVFAIKFRQKDKSEVGEGKTHSTPIEIAWTLPPLLIVLIIFAVGFTGYLDMATPPPAGNAFEVRAVAKKWGWSFYYPNGAVSNPDENNEAYLYLPADRPTKITLESADVLHSLYIPAMRAKKDVVPGRFNDMWVRPDATLVSAEAPQHPLRLNCTEYCGQGHSQMNGYAVIVHASDWDRQMEELKKFNPDGLTPVELGQRLYSNCSACHSVDGASNTGPTWKDLYGSQRQLAVNTSGDEMTVVADEAYIYESIRYPNRKMAVGYANGGMAAYSEAQLSAGDIAGIVAYMKTLTADYQDEALQAFPEGYEGKVPVDEFEASGDPEGDTPEAEAQTPETPAEDEAAPADADAV